MTPEKPETIDAYIAGFPRDVQKILQQVRDTILEIVPEAEETISYGIPAFNLNKTYLVYFAGFKNHIGFYPTPVGMEAFKKDLAGYKTGRGSVQFPLDKPMPLALIRKIVRYRLKENIEKAGNKPKTKK
jgi:uncharacterized protein YdhG (YjbR/CyaY superfamily)